MFRRSIRSRVTVLLPMAAVVVSAALLSLALYTSTQLVETDLDGQQLFKILLIFLLLALLVTPIIFLGVRAYLMPLITPLLDFTQHVRRLPEKSGSARFFPAVGLEEIDTLGQAFNVLVQELDRRQLGAEQEAEKFRLFFDQSSDPVFICSLDGGQVLEANEEARRRLGYTSEELASLSIADLDSAEFAARIPERLRLLQQEGRAVFESVHRTKTGELLPVEINARLITFKEQPAILAVARDISDRKRAERLLHCRSEYFAALHETTYGLLERLELDSLLKTILQRAAGLVGTEHGYIYMVRSDGTEMRMQTWSGIFETLVHTPIKKGQGLSGRVWQNAKPLVVDDYSTWPHRIVELDRQAVHAEVAVPLTGEDGGVEGVIGLAFLEPERQFSEEQVEMLGRFAELASLALHNARLYEAIRAELDERKRLENQLRHSQRMEAIGQLAGGIAHDFNNILTAIIGYAGMMELKLPSDSPCRCGIEHIMASAERAAALTQGLLAYSRKQSFTPTWFDLNEVIRRSSHLLERLIGERIELRLACSEQPLPVLADSGQIEQVLMNLVTNARDAMPDGGTINVQTGCVPLDQAFLDQYGGGRAGQYACFSVSDKGVGMDEATVRQIFEPFFTTKAAGQGTGLGLAIASGIIQQHSGIISCQSSPGQGTQFTVCLPLHEGQPLPAHSDEASLPSGGSEAILLAEDDDAARTMTRRILEEFGYTVIEAINGDEALAKFQQYRDMLSLVVLDVVMPKRTGIDLYRDLHALHPRVRVLFLTAYAQQETLQGGQLPEGVPCLTKPFKPAMLLRKVREVLEV